MSPARPSATYLLFERALIEKKQVTCTYEGFYREICPHILGHSSGQEKALTYQFGGQSGSGLPPDGEWRCLFLSKVRDAQLRDGAWHGGSSHRKPQGCVEIVDIDVNPSSPYDPKRRAGTPGPSHFPSGHTNTEPEARPKRRNRDAWIRALQATSSISANPTRLLADIVDGFSEHTEDRALISATHSLTYSELAAEANRYSRWALEHLAKGDVVCLIMPNRPRYVAIWLGITRVGGIVALINTNLAGASLAHAIAAASPKHVIVAAELERGLREAIPGAASFQTWIEKQAGNELARYPGALLSASERRSVSIHDTALLIYTSGTTGLPKAAKVTHYRILQWSLWFAGLGDYQARDRMYNCLPMYHSVGGIVAIGSVLAVGGSVFIAEKFSASGFWPDIVGSECTLFQYVGELCRYLVNAPPSPEERSHRLRLCCGNGLRADIWANFKQRFNIPQIIEFYAASEGTFSLFNIEDEPGAIGHVPPFLAPRFPAMIVRYDPEREQPYRDEQGRCICCEANEIGEALGRISHAENPETRFDGYVDAAETEQKILRDVFEQGDLWYRTGDLMRMDERGFIYFVDRIGDTFRWKGENVSTLEVAEALSSCRGVSNIAVYGVSVPGADGRAGMAAIAVDESTFALQEFRSLGKERLPSYARPLFVRLCGAIDMTETFKPKKQALAREGFDPKATGDPLYVADAAADTYVRLDDALYNKIQTGAFRL
jgi:fatty-acyl-CoA synthase